MHLLKVSLIGEMATDGYSLITEPLIFPSQDSPFYFFNFFSVCPGAGTIIPYHE